MDLNETVVFTTVARLGSFSKAAAELRMPNSTVSAKVSSLEKRLGVTLLTRTTRKLSLTDAGEAYYRRATQGLHEIQAAETEATAGQAEPSGQLRITAPVELGSMVLPEVAEAFRKKYPRVTLEFELTARTVDLLGEGFDLAIRAGNLKDSSLKAKKLGEVHFAPFASPAYLKGAPPLKHPKDLPRHEILQFSPLGEWQLEGRSPFKLAPSPALTTNDLSHLKRSAVKGCGVALLPTFFCQREIEAGELVRVLPGWRTARSATHFVYPAQRFTPPKLVAFLEVATELVKKSLESCEP